MPYCCVPLCRSLGIRDKISFHQIPSDINRRLTWLKAIARRGPTKDSVWVPNQYDVVCQKHFKPDDYTQGPKRLTLKKDAVPSIFPGYPSYLLSQPKKARQSLVRITPGNTTIRLPNVPDSLLQDKNLNCDLRSSPISTSGLDIQLQEKKATQSLVRIAPESTTVHLPDSHVKDNVLTPSSTSASSLVLQPQAKKIEQSLVQIALESTSVHLSGVPDSLIKDKDLKSDLTSSSTSPSNLDFQPQPKIARQFLVRIAPESTTVHLPDVSDSFRNVQNLNCDLSTSLTAVSSLDPSILCLQNENAALKRKIKLLISNLSKKKKMIKKINTQKKSLLKENAYLVENLTEFSNIEKEAIEGSDHAIFIMDQIKSRHKKFLRWNPEVVKLCLSWHRCSPAGYRYIKKTKFLNLPAERTLQKFARYGVTETDFSSIVKETTTAAEK